MTSLSYTSGCGGECSRIVTKNWPSQSKLFMAGREGGREEDRENMNELYMYVYNDNSPGYTVGKALR